MPMPARILSTLILAALAGTAAGKDDYSWTRVDDVGGEPVKGTVNEEYDFSATGRVKVEDIGGSVEVRTGKSERAGFTYERRAASQRDYDCETLRHQYSKDMLRIWTEHKRGRDCKMIRADDKLIVTVPPRASVEVDSVGSTVKVTGVEGLVKVSSIGDTATLLGVQQVDADSIGDTLVVEITKLGPAGIKIDSIGDSVELTLPEKVDARVRIGSVGDSIRAPGLRLRSDDDDYDTVLGQGGPDIRIDSVGDSVEIHGPRLPQPERKERRRRKY